jgi:uncharacterized damage-inducible protein DinB
MKKSFVTSVLLLTFFCFICSSMANAQAVSSEDIKGQMVKDWERAKAYTLDYLNTMPANKYSFKAHDSIRSFAQQMLHLAAANVFLMSNVTDLPLPGWAGFSLEQRGSAQQKDSVVQYVASSYDYAISAVKNSDMNKWGEKKKIFNRFEETKFAVMNKAFEHQNHHRGHTTIYIRLQGITPPQERLF